jgi:serine/threonine-protein kinase
VCNADGTLLMRADDEIHLGVIISRRYEVLKALARSRSSWVLEANDQQTNEHVAIKLFSTGEEHPQIVRKAQRFMRQAEDQRRLNHRNVVPLLAHGTTSEGNPFLVFELVPAALSLQQLKGQLNRLPLRYAVELFSQVCDGLQYAHEQGVLHQDLAPGDILVKPLDDDGFCVKLTDFAKGSPLLHSDNRTAQLTEAGDIFGHPQYMSPESSRGQTLTVVSNIYSLGCIMFYTLSSVEPFEGAHWGAVLLQKVQEPAPALVPDPIDGTASFLLRIVTKCMANDPTARYQSASELRAALRALLRGDEEIPKFSLLAEHASLQLNIH